MRAWISLARPGTPIRAANRGEIVVAAPMYFTGNTVVVDYGDRLFSVFAHLSEIHVKTGDIGRADDHCRSRRRDRARHRASPSLERSLERRARRSTLSRRRHERRTLNGNRCIWCRFFFRCTTTKAMRSTRTTTSSCGLSSPIVSAASLPTCAPRARLVEGRYRRDHARRHRDLRSDVRRPRSRVVDGISKGSRAAIPPAEPHRPRADEHAALIDRQGSSIPPMTSATSARRRDACSMSARPAGSPAR